MVRLYLPPSLRYLDPMRVVAGQTMDHTSFLYDLVEAVRPVLLVDVGTGAGIAFSVACQSMRDHDVDGLGYAIDSWADDEGKADDDPTCWASLNGYLRAYFRGVAYLMKMAPADALQHFAPGAVGVLRLSPERSGAPLATLIEQWLPRLAPGGVLLCPGVNDPARADLAEQWQTALAGHPTYVFAHGGGLGVFVRAPDAGSAPRPELLQLLTSDDAGDREALARFYAHADRHHAYRIDVQEKWSDLVRRK
jgi:hypothetical protein